MSKAILPPATIGILGGGQLGQMIALEAKAMGYRVVTLDPTVDCPCSQVADEHIVAEYSDLEAARKLSAICDVVTYEFENVDASVVHYLAAQGKAPQGTELLQKSQHRVKEKKLVEQAGCPVAPYAVVGNKKQLISAIETLGLPLVLKTVQGGYDGKGQLVIGDEQAMNEAVNFTEQHSEGLIAEAYLTFAKELSVIVAGNFRGELSTLPVVENIHRNNILHMSIVPPRVPGETQAEAIAIAHRLAKAMNLVGMLAVELFLLPDGRLVVNELAPRPHNSGHFSQQGCHTSQFEQAIRSVCNLPLADSQVLQPTVMVNILGQHLDNVIKTFPRMSRRCKLHLYGKSEAKENRKMGHLNVVGKTIEEALGEIEQLGIWPLPSKECSS